MTFWSKIGGYAVWWLGIPNCSDCYEKLFLHTWVLSLRMCKHPNDDRSRSFGWGYSLVSGKLIKLVMIKTQETITTGLLNNAEKIHLRYLEYHLEFGFFIVHTCSTHGYFESWEDEHLTLSEVRVMMFLHFWGSKSSFACCNVLRCGPLETHGFPASGEYSSGNLRLLNRFGSSLVPSDKTEVCRNDFSQQSEQFGIPNDHTA